MSTQLPTNTYNDIIGTYANLPQNGNHLGQAYHCTDSIYRFIWNGGAWQAFLHNNAVTLPGLASTWTQVNFTGGPSTTATLRDVNGMIGFSIPSFTTNTQLKLITKSVPAAPFHCEAFIKGHLADISSNLLGLYFGDGTKLVGTELVATSAGHFFRNQQWNTVATVGTTVFTELNNVSWGDTGWWLRIGNDGTNLTFDWAMERPDWQNLATQAIGSFLTPTIIGIGGLSDASAKIILSVQAFNITA